MDEVIRKTIMEWNKIIECGKEIIKYVTVAGSLAGIYNIYSTKKEKRKSLKMEQAGKISGWIESSVDSPQYKVRFINNSNKPIYEVIVIGNNFYAESISSLENIDRRSFRIFPHIPPGESHCTLILCSGMSKTFGIEISFTDANGLCWSINQRGKLSNIKKDYLYKLYKLSRPIPFDSFERD